MITVGHKLNGRWRIVAIAANHLNVFSDDVELVILANAEDDGEWVTARMSPDHDASWFWGNYFPPSGELDAWQDFRERVGAYVPASTAR